MLPSSFRRTCILSIPFGNQESLRSNLPDPLFQDLGLIDINLVLEKHVAIVGECTGENASSTLVKEVCASNRRLTYMFVKN